MSFDINEIRERAEEEIKSEEYPFNGEDARGQPKLMYLGKALHERMLRSQAGEEQDSFIYTLEEFFGSRFRWESVTHLKEFIGYSLMDYGYNKRCICGSEHHQPLVKVGRGDFYTGSASWQLICPEGHDAISDQEMVDLSGFYNPSWEMDDDLYYMMKAYEDLLGRVSYLNQVPEHMDVEQLAHFIRANEVFRRRRDWLPKSKDDDRWGPNIPSAWDKWHEENDIPDNTQGEEQE